MNKLTTLRSKHTPTITLPVWTNKLCTTSLHRKDSIFYANRLVTSMYWVVKWATLRKPKLIRIGPQGAPIGPEWKTQAYMNHQRKSYKWRLGPIKPAFLDESPQKGQSTTSLPIIKASPSPCKKARWICPNSKPVKGTWNHAKDPSPSNTLLHERIWAHPNSPEHDIPNGLSPYSLGPSKWCSAA